VCCFSSFFTLLFLVAAVTRGTRIFLKYTSSNIRITTYRFSSNYEAIAVGRQWVVFLVADGVIVVLVVFHCYGVGG